MSTGSKEPQVTPYPATAALRFAGLNSIFRKSQAILDGGRYYHFRKPSGAHSGQFIRTAQTLNDPIEIEFVAVWLLPFLSSEVRAIFCDTASIAAIAYSAVALRQRYVGLEDPIEIATFHSYEFVRDEKQLPRADALYVISATASAHLEGLMIEKGVRVDQIATIFSVGTNKPSAAVLCDLTGDPTIKGAPIDAILNYDDPVKCPYCKSHIPIVDIVGDQFLPINTTIEPVVPIKEDCPKWLAPIMQENCGRGVFRCHFGTGALPNVHDIWVDVESMLAEESLFRTELEKHLHQAIPANLASIFFVGDRVSEQLALIAQEHYFNWTKSKVSVEALTQTSLDEKQTNHAGAALVVTSAISSGSAITGASQLLRDLRPEGKVVFIVGLIRTRTPDEARRVRSNLTYTPSRHYRFALHVNEEFYLPDNSRANPSVWSDEAKLLGQLCLEVPLLSTEARGLIDERIAVIETALRPDVKGLVDNAFWPRSDMASLALRSNFSLFVFDYSALQVSQADVFVAMSALFHRMRTDRSAKVQLGQTAYRRTILDPSAFRRFSDGIVQAAILRAALPPEIDYTLDEQASCEMAGIIQEQLAFQQSDKGEACREFLLSLAMSRLRVMRRDLEAVLVGYLETANQATLEAAMSQFILQKLRAQELPTR